MEGCDFALSGPGEEVAEVLPVLCLLPVVVDAGLALVHLVQGVAGVARWLGGGIERVFGSPRSLSGTLG